MDLQRRWSNIANYFTMFCYMRITVLRLLAFGMLSEEAPHELGGVDRLRRAAEYIDRGRAGPAVAAAFDDVQLHVRLIAAAVIAHEDDVGGDPLLGGSGVAAVESRPGRDAVARRTQCYAEPRASRRRLEGYGGVGRAVEDEHGDAVLAATGFVREALAGDRRDRR